MYYESRQHNIIECNSLKEAVDKIRKGEVQEYEALVLVSKWTGEKFAFVSDTHIRKGAKKDAEN